MMVNKAFRITCFTIYSPSNCVTVGTDDGIVLGVIVGSDDGTDVGTLEGLVLGTEDG